jgi:RNA polymerase sigma-70 factor (ECF subfamily)
MYVEDRPVAEVAELMGVPEGTVKSRAHKARQLMRAALRPAAPHSAAAYSGEACCDG